MADLTTTNVRLLRAWLEGTKTGKRRQVRMVEVHGATVGGETNRMLASAFGLRQIEEVTVGYHRVNRAAVALAPDTDGSKLMAWLAVNNSTTAADVVCSATPNGLYFTVKGY